MIKSIKVGTIITAASIYITLASTLYLYSYWNSFNLDVFEYISLSDIITHAMYGFFSLLGVLLFLTAVFLVLNLSTVSVKSKNRVWGILIFVFMIPEYKALFTPLPSMVMVCFIVVYLIELYTLVYLILDIFSVSVKIRNNVWYFFYFIILTIWILYYKPLMPLYSTFTLPIIAVFIITLFAATPEDRRLYTRQFLTQIAALMLFILMYEQDLGIDKAKEAKQGKGTLLVDLSKSALQLPVDQDDKVSYLGRLGDVFVLYDIDSVPRHLILMEAYNLKRLVLVPAGKGTKK